MIVFGAVPFIVTVQQPSCKGWIQMGVKVGRGESRAEPTSPSAVSAVPTSS